MMNDTKTEEEALADDIFQVDSYEAPMPSAVKGKFLAWHRPRKQYVRHHQWCHEVEKLIKEKFPSGGVLRYLGLPGDDLLDLRHFHSALCEPHGLILRFLGFNLGANPRSPRQTDLNVSLDEVKRLAKIDPQSEVLGDNFSRVANSSSIAFQRARDLGPFDVVNLDLCGGFGSGEPGGLANSYYSAMIRLMALQSRKSDPWLLFLTTRADKANIHADVLQKLVKKYCENLAECDEFRIASRDSFSIDTDIAVRLAVEQADGLFHVFLTGLCKWFVSLALAHKPPSSVDVQSVFGYRVEQEATTEDLVSIALKFTPSFQPVDDPVGLAGSFEVLSREGVLATRALRRVAKRIDADLKLSQDSALFQKMTDATACLLALARYDVDKYRLWAAGTGSLS